VGKKVAKPTKCRNNVTGEEKVKKKKMAHTDKKKKKNSNKRV